MEERSKKKIETNLATELTGLNRTLCRVAGSDLNILSQCPHEISRHARIGAIIISTAVLAAVSMFFAIQTVSQSTFTGLVAGAVWGLAIFILDSYIIASYKKNDNKWKEFKVATPRLFLALVLGCSISIPLELKVFEPEIKDAIDLIELENQNSKKVVARTGYEKDIAPYVQEKNTLQADNDKLDKDFQPFIDKVTKLEGELSDEIGGVGRTGKLSYGPVSKQIDDQLKIARTEKQTKKDEVTPKLSANNKRIGQLDSLIASVQQYPVPKVELFGISAQLDGLKRLTSSNVYVLFAYWIFFLLVIGIETAPIFVKFFTPKGSYDEILAMNEYITFLEQQKRKSDLHELINSEIEAIRSMNEKKKTAQDTVNEKLMTEIATAQGEIGEKAIRLWKAKQLVKVDNNFEDFVRTNEPQVIRNQPTNHVEQTNHVDETNHNEQTNHEPQTNSEEIPQTEVVNNEPPNTTL